MRLRLSDVGQFRLRSTAGIFEEVGAVVSRDIDQLGGIPYSTKKALTKDRSFLESLSQVGNPLKKHLKRIGIQISNYTTDLDCYVA